MKLGRVYILMRTALKIKRVEELAEEDIRISLRAIEALTSFNLSIILVILYDHLKMRKNANRDEYPKN